MAYVSRAIFITAYLYRNNIPGTTATLNVQVPHIGVDLDKVDTSKLSFPTVKFYPAIRGYWHHARVWTKTAAARPVAIYLEILRLDHHGGFISSCCDHACNHFARGDSDNTRVWTNEHKAIKGAREFVKCIDCPRRP